MQKMESEENQKFLRNNLRFPSYTYVISFYNKGNFSLNNNQIPISNEDFIELLYDIKNFDTEQFKKRNPANPLGRIE